MELNGLPEEVRLDLEKLINSPDEAVQTFFRIKDKGSRLVDFVFNGPQVLHAGRSTQFDMVLKARKGGISSRRIARDLWTCATKKHEHRILLTHTDEAATIMMNERVLPMIMNCKIPLRAKPKLSDGYVYFPETESRFYINTAGAKKFGRGDDVTGYHFTEYAHWDSPEVVGGIEESLVDNADGLIESTANGHNFFKKEWEAAKRKESQYRAIFIPWFADTGYSRPNEPVGPLGDDEKALIDEFGLVEGQIAWRRWKRKTMRDPSIFQQEYPETDEQAFISSGRPVFDWVSLSRCRNMVSPAKWRGYLSRDAARVVFTPDQPGIDEKHKGPLRIWKTPEKDHVYAIGSDVAEGLRDGAYSTGEVIDLGDSEQVAEWHGHIAPDLLAEVLELLSAYYNQATIIPESWPGPGEVTTSHLLSKGGVRVWAGQNIDRPGFHTNSRTKPLMIASFVAALRDFSLTIRSPELLEECHAFVYDESGAMGPGLGNFSDRVMGMGIAWYATRDMASRIDYYAAKNTMSLGERPGLRPGGTSAPVWKGPKPGVRSK